MPTRVDRGMIELTAVEPSHADSDSPKQVVGFAALPAVGDEYQDDSSDSSDSEYSRAGLRSGSWGRTPRRRRFLSPPSPVIVNDFMVQWGIDTMARGVRVRYNSAPPRVRLHRDDHHFAA